MALITCPECKRKGVSDRAKACPHCGFPISEYPEEIKYQETERFLNDVNCSKCGHDEFEHKPVSHMGFKVWTNKFCRSCGSAALY